jgi:hypothetical protein
MSQQLMSAWKVPESCLKLPGENLSERHTWAKQLIKLLRDKKATAPGTDRRTDWTPWVKANIHDLIDRADYVVSPEDSKSTKGEFLTLDTCIEERRYPKRILLIAESELDDRRFRLQEIIKDFEKLLPLKSSFKLLVFSSQREGVKNEVILTEIKRGLDGYGHHLLGETYIFIDYNENSGDDGSSIAHVWQSHSNGVNEPAQLICIPPSGDLDDTV